MKQKLTHHQDKTDLKQVHQYMSAWNQSTNKPFWPSTGSVSMNSRLDTVGYKLFEGVDVWHLLWATTQFNICSSAGSMLTGALMSPRKGVQFWRHTSRGLPWASTGVSRALNTVFNDKWSLFSPVSFILFNTLLFHCRMRLFQMLTRSCVQYTLKNNTMCNKSANHEDKTSLYTTAADELCFNRSRCKTCLICSLQKHGGEATLEACDVTLQNR